MRPGHPAIVLLLTGAFLAFARAPARSSSTVWRYAAYSPVPRFEAAGAVVGETLFVFGGFVDSELHITGRVDAYDPARDAWVTRASMPKPLTHAAVAVEGTTVWLAGGFVGDDPGPPTSIVQRYDTARDDWSLGPDLPSPRASAALACLGRKLHLIGGLESRDADVEASGDNHLVLDLDDPDAGWRPAAPLPVGRNHLAALVLGGSVYAIGGQRGHDHDPTDLHLVHRYDPGNDEWRPSAPLPTPRSHFEAAAFVRDGRLVVAGGRNNVSGRDAIDDIIQYDPAADAWSRRGTLPEPLIGPIVQPLGDRLVVAGGGLRFNAPRAATRLRRERGDATPAESPSPPPLSRRERGDAMAGQRPCEPWSRLPCHELEPELPLRFTWSARLGGLADRSGRGTGFTLAAPPSSRLDEDAPVEDATVPGHAPRRLSVTGGRLLVEASPGRFTAGAAAFGNSQLNALGVAVDAGDGLVLEAALGRLPFPSPARERVGIWFGTGEESQVTAFLAPIGDAYRVELGYELGDVPAPLDIATPGACARVRPGLSVRLRLALDPETRLATASCALAAGPWAEAGAIGIDPSLLAGVALPGSREPVSFAGIFASVDGAPRRVTFAFRRFAVRREPEGPSRPRVAAVTPADGAADVPVRAGVVAERLRLPNGGVDARTLAEASVRLLAPGGRPVPASVNTSGALDLVSLQPTEPLAPLTTYVFEVTDGLLDRTGRSFRPFRSSFTTGPAEAGAGDGIAFEKVALPQTRGEPVTSLAVGPGRRLYATTLDGRVLAFPIHADGTLGVREILQRLKGADGTPRIAVGLAVDPAATDGRPVLWVSHTSQDGREWAGAVSRLSGPRLDGVQDYVVGLPRSTLDHLTNGLAFGPDGALYLSQGGNTGTGAPEDVWGRRPERLLSAAILRVDTGAIASPPLDVRTGDGGGYDPHAQGAPVTLYATGVRNAYDLVWHSSGELYAAVNGSNGGETPAGVAGDRRPDGAVSTDPAVPAVTVGARPDVLVRVGKGGYYGHPNPSRGEFVLEGANPTPGTGNDPAEVPEYPDGTRPDPRWRGFVHDLGLHASANGLLEYRGGAFEGALRGALMVARYSQGDDVLVLTPTHDGTGAFEARVGIPGLTGFLDPLDLAEDPLTGNLYVSEMERARGEYRRVTLLRPAGTATAAADTRP